MITSEEPNVALTGRYNTTETCRKLGICKDTLRDWRKKGAIRCGFRRETGRPFYTGAEIMRVWRASL